MKLLTVFLVVVVLSAYGWVDAAAREIIKQNDNFDFYIFVQQWNSSADSSAFTIHGMWAERDDGSYPSFCPGPAFNLSALEDLMDVLQQDWISYDGPPSEFWSHEWEKHGTCSPYSEHQFFSAVLQLYNAFPVLDAFNSSGITPNRSVSHTAAQLSGVLQKVLGGVPVMECYNNKLEQVGFCVDKSLSLMDCPSTIIQQGTWRCPTTGIEFY